MLLHALVLALELNGLNGVGIYRVPGKQKSIKKFICLSNLVSYSNLVLSNLIFCLLD